MFGGNVTEGNGDLIKLPDVDGGGTYLEMEVESLLYLPIKITRYSCMELQNCFSGNICQTSVLVFQLEMSGEGGEGGGKGKGRGRGSSQKGRSLCHL